MLGRNDFGRVRRQGFPLVPVLLDDHVEYLLKLLKRGLSGVHERMTSRKGGRLGDPRAVILTIGDDLIVSKRHSHLE